jgi:hypothetical protein
MKAFLDNFAAVLGTATIGLLLLSVSHEYGYFWIVGSRFQTFLSTTDYFSNAILWLPVLLLVFNAYIDWGVLFGKRTYSFGVNWKWKLVYWVMLLGWPVVAVFIMRESYTLTYALPIIVLWLGVVAVQLPYANADSETLQLVHRAMVATPVIALIAFSEGVQQGQNALETYSEPYQVELKAGGKLNRIVLRAFDKGVLVRDPAESRVEFVRWDDMQGISRLAPPSSKEPFSCAWFNVNCSKATTLP